MARIMISAFEMAQPRYGIDKYPSGPGAELRLSGEPELLMNFRDLAEIETLIACLTLMRGDFAEALEAHAAAQAGDPLAEYQAVSNQLHYAEQEPLPPSVGGWVHEQDGTVCPTHLAPVHHERLWCTTHQQHVRAPDAEPLPPLPQRDRPVRTTVAAVTVTGAADQAQADAEAALARWAHKTASEPRDDDEEQVSP